MRTVFISLETKCEYITWKHMSAVASEMPFVIKIYYNLFNTYLPAVVGIASQTRVFVTSIMNRIWSFLRWLGQKGKHQIPSRLELFAFGDQHPDDGFRVRLKLPNVINALSLNHLGMDKLWHAEKCEEQMPINSQTSTAAPWCFTVMHNFTPHFITDIVIHGGFK